ncbi:8946_t:CDS:2, partial [Gigaspora margarita]
HITISWKFQTKLPSSLPFEKYLALQTIESSFFAAVHPPRYARASEFRFDLSVLFEDKTVLLNVTDTSSHETDLPGTGNFADIEIMKVLIANKEATNLGTILARIANTAL